jgi:hypothetical protein
LVDLDGLEGGVEMTSRNVALGAELLDLGAVFANRSRAASHYGRRP